MRVLRTLTTTAFALVAAAILTPAASAEPIVTGPMANVPPAVTEIHDRPVTTPAVLQIHDRPVVAPVAAAQPTATPVAATPSGGIDWTDVTLGIGIGIVALLALEGVVHFLRHPPTRHPPLASH